MRTRQLALCFGLLVLFITGTPAVWERPALGQDDKKAEKDTKGDKAEEDEEAAPKTVAWQFSPYRIKVWVAFDDDGRLTPSLLEAIRQRIHHGAEAVAFSTWKVDVSAPPGPIVRAEMIQSLADITPNRFFTLAGFTAVRLSIPGQPAPKKKPDEEQPKWLLSPRADTIRDEINGYDKIMLVTVKASPLGYVLEGREVDTATRNLGLVHRRETRQRATLGDQAFGIVHSAFRPLVRITAVERNAKDATGLVRAGGLVEGPGSPSAVMPNDALLPVIRTNDRLGLPKDFNGIRAMEWSYLHVEEQDNEDVKLRLHTALRSPLGGRSGSRVRKYGLKVRPRTTTSVVRLISKGRQRPLPGYEIFSRHLANKEDSVLLGITDWNGEIEVSQLGEYPLRLLYIKNGGSLLAGIPILPGHHEHIQAEMRDDEPRLKAEAFVKSVQNTVVVTVAQRKMIASRIDASLKKRDVNGAKEHLAKYRKLATLESILDLMSRRKKDMSTEDRRMRLQIDSMFEKTQELAIDYLDDKEEIELNRKINDAERAGG